MEKILITGSTGLIGNNLVKYLCSKNRYQIINPTRRQLNLLEADSVLDFVQSKRPDIVIHLAAKVGGIQANRTMKYDFYRENSCINNNVVNASIKAKVKYFLAMGTGCAYPKSLEGSRLFEESFLDGCPEPTNDAYAYAKRDLLVQLAAANEQFGFKFSYVIPANIYGPHDNFHPLHSHVVPGMIERANQVNLKGLCEFDVWGDGTPTRDFLYISDLISAINIILEQRFVGALNVASANPITITSLAKQVLMSFNLDVPIKFDSNYPNGQNERIFDNSKILKLGWSPEINLTEGINQTVKWYIEQELVRRS